MKIVIGKNLMSRRQILDCENVTLFNDVVSIRVNEGNVKELTDFLTQSEIKYKVMSWTAQLNLDYKYVEFDSAGLFMCVGEVDYDPLVSTNMLITENINGEFINEKSN